MPIRAYFEPVRARLNWVNLRGGLAGSGIKVEGPVLEGPVLEGRMTVDEALVLSWIRGAKQVDAAISSAKHAPGDGPTT